MAEQKAESKAAQQRRQYQQYLAAFPEIKRRLGAGEPTRSITEHLADQYSIDQKAAYTWVFECEQRLERNARRVGIAAVAGLWAALALLVTAGVLLFSAGVGGGPAWYGLSFFGVTLAAAIGSLGIGVVLLSARRALASRMTAPL